MEEFLQETKHFLETDDKIHVVIGNESCDLDSVVAALTYSYFLHKTSSSSQTRCLPVLNTPKSQFHLRTDSKYLLSQTGINPDLLTFKDDLDLHELHLKGRLSLTLVDHNVLTGDQASLEDSVVMVIDHHPLERMPCDRVKVVLDMVASCCSLVAGIMLDCPELTLTPQIATMLMGTIIVDTVNTSPEAGKTTPYDREILGRLMQVVPDLDPNKLFNQIQEAKNDVSAFTTQEVLEKDLKCVTHSNQTVVMSSIPVSLETFLQRIDIKQALDSVMQGPKAQSVVVMTMHDESGAAQREMLLFSHNEEELKKLAEFLKSNKDVQLDLQPLTCDLKYSFAYRQGNVRALRKKVLTLVKSFLQTTSIPQDELLLNFDHKGSDVSASALVDFSADSTSPSVPTNMDTPSTNQSLLFDPIMTDTTNANSTASEDLLGLFDSNAPSQKKPLISVTLPKSPEGGFTAGIGIPDLLGDFTESDVMESPLRTPDLMQSLSEASSGPGSTVNSRPGSEFPSHTVTPPETGTPPNSLISSGFHHSNNEFTLPSMNNAETIEKIQQKKEQMMRHQLTSRLRGDSADSCPYTPHNSVADFQFDTLAKEHNLRTLNNSQMVREVEQKRKSLGGEVDSVSLLVDQEGAENVPFTPCNSFVSEQFSYLYNRDTSLRSLNNAEMVQQIQEKRASMSGIASSAVEEGEENEECNKVKKREEVDEEDDVVPFTPQNSFMESNFDRLAKEHNLPSLNNADMVQRVQQKRSSLGNMLLNPEEDKAMSPGGGGEDGDLDPSYSPFTPQNSFVESNMEKYGRHGLDMNSLNDRLLDVGQDKSVINPPVPNLLDFDSLSGTPENVVAKVIAQEMLKDNQENSVSDLLDLNFGEDGNGDGSSSNGGRENHGKSSGIMGVDGSQGAQQDGSQPSETSPSTDTGPVDEVAFSLAGKLIEHVLDNFEPSDLLADTTASNGAVVVPVSMETIKQEEQAAEVKSQGPQSLLVPNSSSTDVKKIPSSGQLLGLETDYLSKVDLFHGNYNLMSNQGNQEVVESSSFRKISGEAPQTVREEILDSISRESFDRSRAGEEGSKDITENGIEEEQEGMMEEIKVDTKIEEGMNKARDRNGEEKVGIEEQEDNAVVEEESDLTQTEGDEEVTESEIEPSPSDSDRASSTSPTQHVARELLDTVIKSAVEIVQSEMEDETSSGNLRKPKLPSQSIFNFDTTDDMEESGSSPSDASSPTTTEASYRLSSPDLIEGANDLGVIGLVSSGLSIGSISSESLSSYTGFKSDINLDRTGRSMASMGSISNESLSSYSHVKSDMNLDDLSPEHKDKTKNLTSGKEKLEVEDLKTKGKTKVIFKVDSFTDDNLEENSDKVKVREKEKVKVDSESKKEVYMTTAGRISIKVDDEALISDLSPSKGQDGMSSVTEESSLVTSLQSNEGLPLMSVSSDPFESVDSVATEKEDEKEVLEENKRNPSNDMMESDSKLKDRLGGLDLADEWQEDDIPGMPPAENVSDDSSDSEGSRSRHSSNSSHSSSENPRVRHSSLNAHPKRKITANFSILSDELEDDGMDPADGLEWENDTPIKQTDPLPEFSAKEEYNEAKLWKGVEIGGKTMKIDLKVIEPYKRVLSHGGYYGDGLNAIIIFSGCFLPDRSRRDYQYVMDNLFMYVISTLETLVAEDYMIVYFHGATPRRQMPSFGWLKKCYQMIDRRLRKNLKSLLLVHPTLWLRTVVMMTRPFISAKFSSKLRFVRSLSELGQIIPMEYIFVPEAVQQYDDRYLQQHTAVNSPLSHSPEPLTSPS